MRILTSSLFLFASFFATSALARSTAWTSLNTGVYGGNVTSVFSLGNYLFAGTYINGIYVSSDNGNNRKTAATFDSLIIICWSIFLFVWFMSSLGVKKANQETGERQRSWIRLLVFLVIIYFFNPSSLQKLVGSPLLSVQPLVRYLGIVICAGGVAFAIWAKFHLGANWGAPMAVTEKPELVTTGPYRFVRHPIYAGICLGMFGSGLAGGLPWFIWFVFLSVSFLYSAKQEEKLMERQFPGDYGDYKKRTKMMVPYIL